METVKRCSRCKKEKGIDEFNQGRRVCSCCSQACKKYQQENPEKARDNCKKYYDKNREEILEKKKEKTWCDLCEMHIVKDQLQRHNKTMRHRHYLKLEEGDTEEQKAKGKFWCEICRIWLGKKAKAGHLRTPRHLELEQRRSNLED